MDTGFDPMELTIATEDLYTAFASLSDEQRQMVEVIEVMENVSLSMQTLKLCGAEAIKVLNIDKSLENLVGVSEDKLTVQKAQESLSEVAKKTIKAAIDVLKAFIAKIRNWVRAFVRYVNAFRIKILALDGTLNALDLPGCPVPPKDSGKEMHRYIKNCRHLLGGAHTKYAHLTKDEFAANPNVEQEFNEEVDKICSDLDLGSDGHIPSLIADEFEDGKSKNWRECGYTTYRGIIDAANTGISGMENIKWLVEHFISDCEENIEKKQRELQNDLYEDWVDVNRFSIKVSEKILRLTNCVMTISAKYSAIWRDVINGANKSTKNPETWRIGGL